MKLKNNALQELYDELVESPVEKAFGECDEKLSESVTFEQIKKLENDIDIWKRSNATLLSANLDLANKKRNLEKEIKGLQEHIDILSASEREALTAKKQVEDELSKLKEHVLEDHKIITNINSERDDLVKDLDDAKKQLKYFMQSRDDWRSRAKHAEDELKGANKQIQALKDFNSEITSKNVDIANRNVGLARKNELLEATLQETKETLEKANADRTELQKDRDSYHGLYTELRKDYDKLFEENKKLKARTDCHRYEVEWYRKHYKEKSDKIQELKKQLDELTSQYQKLTIENKRLHNSVLSGYDQGQTDLWVKLQNVNDSQPFELATCFPDVTGMEDILSWDLEDFLDAYKKWWEEKEKDRLDHMRDYLARFCEGRLCEKCPLGSDKFKCGNGYSFRRRDQFDTRIIPDEELERYYEKARGGSGKIFVHDLSHTMENVNRGITKACEDFCKAVRDADIKTKENIHRNSWECTLEATVEIDKDLLEKVCGVKPDDK